MQILKINTRDKSSFKLLKKIFNRAQTVDSKITDSVKEIIDNVKKNGDKALFDYTLKFDGASYSAKTVLVSKKDTDLALKRVKKTDMKLLEQTASRIRKFHERQLEKSWFTNDSDGIILGQLINPIERVGIYVPGGKAAYPSTVLMNAIPAKIAGVSEIIMVTPAPMGKLNDIIVAAAAVSGVDKIFKVGGAQAVAALAYGTKIVPKVDKIAGPGNIYVAEAKKMLYGTVGIDMVAGPSEILIVADGTTDPSYAAADMLSQAEHDEMACVYLVTHNDKFAKKVMDELEKQLKTLKRVGIAGKALSGNSAVIITKDLKESVDIANKVAPEHLELAVREPFAILADIRNAGAVFMGESTPEALGDYNAGPNHTLPTGGTARFYSPLGVYDFIKKSSVIYYTKDALRRAGNSAMKMADLEGLEAHSKAVSIRLKE